MLRKEGRKMGRYAAKYTCGSCKYYEYEGENSKGYCSWYRNSYFPDDSCNHWEELESGSGSDGCFLTTACCEYKSLPDDCMELQVMRGFRDNYLKGTAIGRELIQMYYSNAPQIVEKINAKINKKEIYEEIYARIQEVIKAVENKLPDEAIALYVKLIMYAEAVTQD